MRASNFKGGRVIKKSLIKSQSTVKCYDKIQVAYADILENDVDIYEIRCNVLLDGLDEGDYTSDFVCTKNNGELMVRECVFRKKLSLPRTCKLLDASKTYWARRGVTDWAIVVESEGVLYEEK